MVQQFTKYSHTEFETDKPNGFTLLEISIVASIIAALLAIAVPNFIAYQKETITLEVKKELYRIRNLQIEYLANESQYGNLDSIGWTAPTGKNRYTYWLRYSATKGTFRAIGKGNIDGDKCTDKWRLNQKNKLEHRKNDIRGGNQNRTGCK